MSPDKMMALCAASLFLLFGIGRLVLFADPAPLVSFMCGVMVCDALYDEGVGGG